MMVGNGCRELEKVPLPKGESHQKPKKRGAKDGSVHEMVAPPANYGEAVPSLCLLGHHQFHLREFSSLDLGTARAQARGRDQPSFSGVSPCVPFHCFIRPPYPVSSYQLLSSNCFVGSRTHYSTEPRNLPTHSEIGIDRKIAVLQYDTKSVSLWCILYAKLGS